MPDLAFHTDRHSAKHPRLAAADALINQFNQVLFRRIWAPGRRNRRAVVNNISVSLSLHGWWWYDVVCSERIGRNVVRLSTYPAKFYQSLVRQTVFVSSKYNSFHKWVVLSIQFVRCFCIGVYVYTNKSARYIHLNLNYDNKWFNMYMHKLVTSYKVNIVFHAR